MGFKIGVAIPIGYYHGASGQTIRARIVDESGGVFGAELTLVENAAVLAAGRPGFYESTFTPDAAGTWTALIYYSSVKYGQMFYDVGGGLTTQEKTDVQAEAEDALEGEDLDHLLKVAHPTGDPVADTILDLIMNKGAGQTFDRATDSLEFLGEITAAIIEMLGTPGLFESTAATVNTVTCPALVDRAGLYEKMMIVPVEGDQKGMGRYITEYDGTGVLTVVPDWSTDPDASGNFRFTIMPVPEGFLYEAGKGLSASYDLINGIVQFTRVYNDHTQTDAAGTEDTIFEYDNAPYAWKPTYLMVHLDEMVDGDHIEVRIYEKDNDTDDNWRLFAHKNYFDAQSVPARPIRLPPVDLALKVTSAQTGGAARTNLFKLYKES